MMPLARDWDPPRVPWPALVDAEPTADAQHSKNRKDRPAASNGPAFGQSGTGIHQQHAFCMLSMTCVGLLAPALHIGTQLACSNAEQWGTSVAMPSYAAHCRQAL